MLLAVDTASAELGLALYNGQQVLAEWRVQSANRHTLHLSPLLQQLLAHFDLKPQHLNVLAVSAGAGSFSGLRVGFSVLKGMASALRIPLIAIPTLEIVAKGTPFFAGELWACVTAGRGRLIAGRFLWQDTGWQAQDSGAILSMDDLLGQLTPPSLLVGEVLLGQPLPPQSYAFACPRQTGVLAKLAYALYEQGLFSPSLSTVNPLYLKAP
jgi:tRNA threonylcarbamoyladenosine biosynthesis protein TsaB